MQATALGEPKLYSKIDFESGGIIKNATEQALKGTVSQEKAINLSNQWDQVFKIGPGLQNMGNTCFFNSVLQCITYTPSLANYLLSKEHDKVCLRANSFCAICLLQHHLGQCFAKNRNPSIQPRKILQNMRYINKKFKLGRQDDSHELLRLLLESMQKSALDFKPKVDQKQEEATPIYQIFGGKLKSSVQCSGCQYNSENFETFYDLSLECKESVQKGLEFFFKKEQLKGNNKYRCSKCKKLVEATKGYTINTLPNILTLQIKRFNNSMMKINSHTYFPQELDLQKYTQLSAQQDQIYDLYAVLVHVGGGLHFGHYYCYVKNSNNMWYCMDDSSVSQRSFQEISRDRAYLLFYSKRNVIKRTQRKSSADLSQISSKQTEPHQKVTLEKEVIPKEEGNTEKKQQKSLREEYEEGLKTQECKEHLKKLDEIFSLKTVNGKQSEVTTNNKENEKVINGKTKGSTDKIDQSQKEGAIQIESVPKKEQIENIQVENNIDESSSSEMNLERQLGLHIFNRKFRVINLKRIHKLQYMNRILRFNKRFKQDVGEVSLFNLKELKKSLESNLKASKIIQKKPISNGCDIKIKNKTKVDQLLEICQKPSSESLIDSKTINNQLLQSTTPSQDDSISPGNLLKALSQKSAESSNKILALPQQQNLSILNIGKFDELAKGSSQSTWNTQESAQISLGRKSVIEMNKSQFQYEKKEKDEYDVEYDKGKMKKIKKKKEKQRINFNSLYNQQVKQKQRTFNQTEN